MAVSRFPIAHRPIIKRIPCTVFEPIEKDANGDSKKRYFRFDLNALADFEQEVGMGFGQLMSQKAGFAMVRALFFCGLKHEDRSLNIERVGDMLSQLLITEDPDARRTLDELTEIAFSAMMEQKAIGQAKPVVEEAAPEDTKKLEGAVIDTTAQPETK